MLNITYSRPATEHRANTAVLADFGLSVIDDGGSTRTVTRNGEAVATVTRVRPARLYGEWTYRVVAAGVPAHVGGLHVCGVDVVGAVLALIDARDAHLAAEAEAEAAYTRFAGDPAGFLDFLMAR